MNKPHPHAEIIKAWADGAEIESRPLETFKRPWAIDKNPGWLVTFEYRIKPAKREARRWWLHLGPDGEVRCVHAPKDDCQRPLCIEVREVMPDEQ